MQPAIALLCVWVAVAASMDPEHLLDARTIVSAVTANGNSTYDSGSSESHFVVWDGANSGAKTQAASFFRLLLQHSYGLSEETIVRWTGSTRPSSMQWWNRVDVGDQFTPVALTFASLQLGDFVFSNSSTSGTANIWIVSGLPSGPIVSQTNATVTTYTIEIIDSSNSYHGNWDTRYNPVDRRSNFGLGRGYVKLLFNTVGGELIGHTFSNATSSTLYTVNSRRMSFTRLTLNVTLFEDSPIVRADPGDMPQHLIDGLQFLEYLTISGNNSYQYGYQYQVWDGANSATVCVCSEFCRMTLEHSYVTPGTPTIEVRNSWKAGFSGHAEPQAKYWYQNIVSGDNFTQILAIDQVMPGDIIAMAYPDDWNDFADTGHVAMVRSAPSAMSPRALPSVAGTVQYAVEILDCSKSPHGDSDDTRLPDRNGTGSGVLRLYIGATNSSLVGYSWSRSRSSVVYLNTEVPFAIGRILPNFLHADSVPTPNDPSIASSSSMGLDSSGSSLPDGSHVHFHFLALLCALVCLSMF